VDSFDQCTFASLNNKHFLGIQRATQCFSISKIIGSYSQSHCEGDRPRNTAKREERHLKLFVEEDEKTLPKEKKEYIYVFFTFKTNPNRPVSMYRVVFLTVPPKKRLREGVNAKNR